MRTLLAGAAAMFAATTLLGGELPGWGAAGRDGASCAPCGQAGAGDLDVAALLTIELGPGTWSRNVGRLVLRSPVADPSLATPGALELEGAAEADASAEADVPMVLRTADETVRQVVTSRIFIDILPNTQFSYRIRVMLPAAKGPLGDDHFYTFDNAAAYLLREFTVENPDASLATYNRLRIRDVTGATKEWMFVYSQAVSGWNVTVPGNLGSIDLVSQTDSATSWTLIKRYRNPAGAVVAQQSQSYVEKSWGLAIVAATDGAGTEARTRTWTYYETAQEYTPTPTRPPIQTVLEPDGSWRMVKSYDDQGRPLVELHGIDTGVTDNEALGRKVVNSYAAIDNNDNLSRDPRSPRRVDEYWKNEPNPIRRTYYKYGPASLQVIQCNDPNSAAVVTGNVVTETTFEGNNSTTVTMVRRPDGTISRTSQSLLDGTITTTTDTGEPNTATPPAVSNGTRTVTVERPTGTLESEVVRALANGVEGPVLSSTVNGNFDAFDRPRTITTLQGVETLVYESCCGLASRTDAEGIVRTFDYDDLGRLNSETLQDPVQPIVSSKVIDIAGRTLEEWRSGSTSIRQSLRGYDTSGFMTSEVDRLGGTYTYVRSKTALGFDQVVVTQPDQSTRITVYLADGREERSYGTATAPSRFEYGTADTPYGGVTKTLCYTKQIPLGDGGTDTTENVITFRDALDRPVKTLWPDTAAAYVYYDSKGLKAKEVDADQVTTLYRYNGQGELVVTAIDINRDGSVANYDPNVTVGNDRVTKTTTSYLAYDAPDNARGYDIRRTVTEVWTTAGSEAIAKVRTDEVSLDGKRSWNTIYKNQSTPVTQQTVTEYLTGAGKRVTKTMPDGSYTRTVFANGLPATEASYKAGGTETVSMSTFGYDGHRRLHTIIDARNGTTTFDNDDADRVWRTTAPAPGTGDAAQTTVTYFDAMGRVTGTLNPDNSTVTNFYTPAGKLQLTYGSRTYAAQYGYDAQGRMTTMTTWSSFNPAGGSTGGRTTTWNYHAQRGWLVKKTYPDLADQTDDYEYYLSGRLKMRHWDRGVDTTYAYNEAGDLYTINYSDTTPDVGYTYDRRGRRETQTSNGLETRFTYTDADQPLTETHTGGTLGGLSVSRTYYDTLQLWTVTALNGGTTLQGVTYGYDTAGRLGTVADGALVGAYAYHANSRLIRTLGLTNGIGTQLGLGITRAYDRLNRLQSVSSRAYGGQAPALPQDYGYQHNTANQRTRTTLADGSFWSYNYDALGQVTGGKRFWSDGTPVAGQQFEYGFDDIGNRTSSKTGGDTSGSNLRSASWVNDVANKLTGRGVPGYVEAGGLAAAAANVLVNNGGVYRKGEYFRKELTVSNGSGPAWTSVDVTATAGTTTTVWPTVKVLTPPAAQTFQYDADGNLQNDGVWVYVWDAENRLVQVYSTTAVPTEARKKVVCEYDPQGRRIRKRVYLWATSDYSSTPTSDVAFLYDGWNLVAEVNATAKTLVRGYVWGTDLSGSMQGAGGVGGLLWVRPSGQNPQFVAHDGNGNVVGWTDAANGAATARHEYGPFGEPIRRTGTLAAQNPFRWSTKYTDDETDLVYYGYRYYSPGSGRWLSRDPLEEDGGEGLYVFAANDTGSHVDLFGLTCTKITGEVDLSHSIEVPLGLFLQADGNIGMHIYPSGKSCDCCGDPKAVKAQGTLTATYELEAGITVGKRINKTLGGISFMGFLGVRLAGNGAGGGAGEFTTFCDGTSKVSMSGKASASIIGQGGAMFQYAYPKGWPKRLTGPPWGERTGIAVMLEGTGGVTVTLTGRCKDDTCVWHLDQTWDVDVTGRIELGPIAANGWTLYSGSTDGASLSFETGNPFKY